MFGFIIGFFTGATVGVEVMVIVNAIKESNRNDQISKIFKQYQTYKDTTDSLSKENNKLRRTKERFKLENTVLERRLRHLLQSEFIRSFDSMGGSQCKEYVRDIKEADIIVGLKQISKTEQESE